MWPFKKRKEPSIASPPSFESILCIPGPWNTHEDFILSVISSSRGQYLAAGPALMNVKENWHCSFEVCEYDGRMRTSFECAGKVTRVTQEFLSKIEQHKTVVYVKAMTGDLQSAERLARAGLAMLQAGGFGIKVETAGKAFMPQDWEEKLQSFEPSNLIQLFVLDSIADEQGAIFSCGMQNLGYKDTIVSGEEIEYAVYLVSLFAYYQIIDQPVIEINQTFSATADSPVFRITEEPSPPYRDDELFRNPWGMWRLTRL